MSSLCHTMLFLRMHLKTCVRPKSLSLNINISLSDPNLDFFCLAIVYPSLGWHIVGRTGWNSSVTCTYTFAAIGFKHKFSLCYFVYQTLIALTRGVQLCLSACESACEYVCVHEMELHGRRRPRNIIQATKFTRIWEWNCSYLLLSPFVGIILAVQETYYIM